MARRQTRKDGGAPAGEIGDLLDSIDQAFDRSAWHGTNLRGAIRRMSAAQAARRPGAGRHNIWEIVVHAAYWKYAVWRRLTGARRGSFPLRGSNWFPRPAATDASEASWKSDVRMLEQVHAELRRAIAELDPRSLDRGVKGSRHSRRRMIHGIALHDVYHAGQIQLLKRLTAGS
ncbi:MAG: DinB family protein [Acidobacteriota bacterium]